jgi:hypothetical protein
MALTLVPCNVACCGQCVPVDGPLILLTLATGGRWFLTSREQRSTLSIILLSYFISFISLLSSLFLLKITFEKKLLLFPGTRVSHL